MQLSLKSPNSSKWGPIPNLCGQNIPLSNPFHSAPIMGIQFLDPNAPFLVCSSSFPQWIPEYEPYLLQRPPLSLSIRATPSVLMLSYNWSLSEGLWEVLMAPPIKARPSITWELQPSILLSLSDIAGTNKNHICGFKFFISTRHL